MVNCKVDGWNDYGAFLESFPQVCIIGCYFGQKPGAYNHTGKVWNVPTRPNTPNHGALRIPDTVQAVLQRNVFRTLNTWSGRHPRTWRAAVDPRAAIEHLRPIRGEFGERIHRRVVSGHRRRAGQRGELSRQAATSSPARTTSISSPS
jgi:hypothetical protein